MTKCSLPSVLRATGTNSEERLLRGAITDVEGLNPPSTALATALRSWLCYRKRLFGMTAYMTHRAGWDHVGSAYSAAELGLKIVRSGGQPSDGAGKLPGLSYAPFGGGPPLPPPPVPPPGGPPLPLPLPSSARKKQASVIRVNSRMVFTNT